MNLAMVRGMIEQVGRRRRSSPSESSRRKSSEASDDAGPRYSKPPTDEETLRRAREAHTLVGFGALAAGPNIGGPWQRVEGADGFVVYRKQDVKGLEDADPAEENAGPEVMCAGRLDACIEEMTAVLCPLGEDEHNAVMTVLYAKRFLCGSFERSVRCSDKVELEDECTPGDNEHGEELAVKTSSFARSALFGNNEQWCFTDFFQRKAERDGFTVSQRSLTRDEATPGRITATQTRVDQMNDLSAAYLVDLEPQGKGLRVVFNAKFMTMDPSAASPAERAAEGKVQARRLQALAHGVAKIPELIRCRRFGFQLPADLSAIQVSNARCPCCTRSLSPVKMSLSAAASALSRRSLAPLKMDTRRCYLCGYLVCIECWSAERAESFSGRVASIVVCRRCQASVDACDYADISSDRATGPAQVVADPPESTTAALLVDLLADSLAQAPPGSPARASLLAVVRTLLEHDYDSSEEDGEEDAGAAARVSQFLTDEHNLPLLEDCTLGNAERRDYVLDLPEDPVQSVPRGPIPSNEAVRLLAAESAGLLLLADDLAPEHPPPAEQRHKPVDVRDLELLCKFATLTLGCASAMISIMSASHEHVLASTDPNFAGAAVPRDYTMCQHQLMSQDPVVLIHPEADVRLQAIGTIKLLSLRSYIGFPITAPLQGAVGSHVAVGTLCCIDSKPHAELTRSQYAIMQNLARTASQLVQLKGLQLQQHA